MACSITLSGLVRDCEANVGGVKAIALATRDDVSGVTISDDAVSAISMANSATFKTYYFKRGQASVTSTPQFNDAGEYAGEQAVLSVNFLRQDATKRLAMATLSVAELYVLYEDANDQWWLLGYDNPVVRTGGESATGAAASETNQYALELTASDRQLAYYVPSTIAEGVLDA